MRPDIWRHAGKRAAEVHCCRRDQPSPPARKQQRPVSVVVGAGPAGILTAVFLARRGHEVHIYDRRPSPLVCDASDDTRAFVIALHARGQRALAAAGFDLPALAAPGSGLQTVAAMAVGARQQRMVRFPVQRLVGPRHAFVAGMVAQAQALHPEAIAWHWGSAFEAADLTAKTATFVVPAPGRGSSDSSSHGSDSSDCPAEQWCSRAYDLLIAADGCRSRVRRAAEKQVPELRCSVEPSPVSCKVFRGLPPSAALPVELCAPVGDGAAQEAAAAGVQLRLLFSSGLRHPAVLFAGRDPSSPGGGIRGLLGGPAALWEGLRSEEEHAALLAQHFPALPREWVQLMAAQMAAAPAAQAGALVHASQLHGPALLLVGDAGHGVTPRTGNGMNAALEDALIIDQLLAESGGDVSSLPERFTAARLADAHALLWLDGNSSSRNGTARWAAANPWALAQTASMLCRGMLSRASGGWVAPHAPTEMNNTCLPYSQVKAQVVRDGLLAAAAALTVPLMLAGAALLALRGKGAA
ncbi:hypothetical protein ABPG75_010426 [Micractinium tetrahymenae]